MEELIKRDKTLDFVAGVLMLIVLLHHAGILKSGPYTIMHVFNFFMPWFFFKAGMFHKYGVRLNKQLLLKYCKRYVVPLFFCLVTSLIIKINGINFENGYYGLLNEFINANGVVWFLVSLLIVKIILIPKIILRNNSKNHILLLSALFILLAYMVNSDNENIPLVIKEVMAGLFYYIAGVICRNRRFEEWKQIIFLIITYGAYIILQPSVIDMRMEYVLWGEYGIGITSNIVGIVLINSIAYKCEKIQPLFVKK